MINGVENKDFNQSTFKYWFIHRDKRENFKNCPYTIFD